MKVDVCLKCSRFFHDNFSYCPFCGEKLKAYELTESNISDKTKKSSSKNEKSAKKDGEQSIKFYDSLLSFQKDFIDIFTREIIGEYPRFKMIHKKSHSYFVYGMDESLEDYAHWFYFSNSDGLFTLKYRNTPSSKEKPKELRIRNGTNPERVADTILRIIKKRLDWYQDMETKKDLPLLDKELRKKLPPKPEPKSVFLTGYSPNCRTSSAEGSRTRKMQKDIWKD